MKKIMYAVLGIGLVAIGLGIGLLAVLPLQSVKAAPTVVASCTLVSSTVTPTTFTYQVTAYAESKVGGGIGTLTLRLSQGGFVLAGSDHNYSGPPYPDTVSVAETYTSSTTFDLLTVSVYDKQLNERATGTASCAGTPM